MRYLAFALIVITLTSCKKLKPENWDPQPRRVSFNIYAQEDNAYREIRIYGNELKDSLLVPFDSVICNARNRNGTEETFPKGRGYGLSFFADSLLRVQSGSFEAVAVRKDFSLVRKSFGKITAGKTNESFKITLIPAGIVVEEM